MAEANVYAAADRAIHSMNREILRDFGQLKLADWDKVHIIRTVKTVYRKSAKKARARYYEVAFEAYLLGLELCGYDRKKAYGLAEKAITGDWVDRMMGEPDPVTGYRFDAEAERKAERLAETLEVAANRNAEIDRAIRYWSQQCGQFCINYADWAMRKAFEDAGVEKVRWHSVNDEKRCRECRLRDGKVFPIEEVPVKHPHCRCWLSKA